jgi:hypothetical protein
VVYEGEAFGIGQSWVFGVDVRVDRSVVLGEGCELFHAVRGESCFGGKGSAVEIGLIGGHVVYFRWGAHCRMVDDLLLAGVDFYFFLGTVFIILCLGNRGLISVWLNRRIFWG